MHIERLKHMAKLLRSIPPQNFDLMDWTQGDDSPTDITKEIECGTVCCAVGWACTDPWFNQQGLHWGSYPRPVFEELCSWSAVEKFFGLDSITAHWLFDPNEYRSLTVKPTTVMGRIYTVIRKHS